MTLNDAIQGFSGNLADVMVEAFGSLFTFADNTYHVTQKVAFIILCAALIVQGWRGRTAQDVTIWLWVLLSLLIATVTIGNWLNITRPPDGAAWQFGQSLANAVGNVPQDPLKDFFNGFFPLQFSKINLFLNLKAGLICLCVILSQVVVYFMRIIQMAMIAILYSLGPIFVSFICIGVLRNAGIRYMFTLASMYSWDLAWKFVDAGSAALLSFGGLPVAVGQLNFTDSSQGYFNPLMLPLTLVWAIVAPIFLPIFLSRLFISGASGFSDTAQGFAMGQVRAAGRSFANGIGGQTPKQLGQGLATRTAAVAAGVGAVAGFASSALSRMGKMMSGAKQLATGESGGSQESSTPTSGPLQAGQSIKAGGTSIKRNSAESFSIGKQNFSGDPNNANILYSALTQTDLSHTSQATIRHDMRERQST